MNSNVTKEKEGTSFSYLDLILLILAFLVFSLGIGLLFDSQSRKNNKKDFTVILETVLPVALRDSIPEAGEIIFGEDGETVGKILSSTVSDDVAGIRLEVCCCFTEMVQEEELTVETLSFIRTMKVLSVEENKGESQ